MKTDEILNHFLKIKALRDFEKKLAPESEYKGTNCLYVETYAFHLGKLLR